jgi:outer membrane protein assembly factor BamA
MTRKINIAYALLLACFLTGCSVGKYIPASEKLYNGAKVKVMNADSSSRKIPSTVQIDLETLLRPKPNTRVLGFPLKVATYYLFGEPKSEKGLKNKFRKRFGEKPVFITQTMVDKNMVALRAYLDSKGYFRSRINGSLKVEKHLATAVYDIGLTKPYLLDTINYVAGTTTFEKDFLATEAKSLLDSNAQFDFEVIRQEIDNVSLSMRNNGYYYFRPDYVALKADSTDNNHKINLYFELRETVPEIAKKQYQINDIFVYTDVNSGTDMNEKVDENADLFRGLILTDPAKKYKERIFSDAIGFRPGSFYNSDLESISTRRLVGLNNFRFVKTRFDVVNRLDSTFLNVYYYLQPQKKMTLRAELNGISRSSGLAGSQLSLNWQNINAFKGAEIFRIAVNGGLELQVGGNKDNEYRDNYRLAVESSVAIPRFIFPFIKIDPENSRVLPKTLINFSYENFIKKGLYNLNSYRGSVGYAWRRNETTEHTLYPLNLTFVKATNISTAFIDQIFADPRLLYILENQFIPSGSYSITYSPAQKTGSRHSVFYSGRIDLAGNIAGLLDKFKGAGKEKGFFLGERFSQFARLENDFRYRYDISPNLKIANRVILGVGLPYGNSYQLPTVSQFYVGGNNSIRAFRARGVGPGTYEQTDDAELQYIGNNTGDIKIELNTELRYKLNSLLGTAFFIDAGNVWMAKDENLYGPGSLFSKNFYKEMAVGTGIGLRIDFTFVVFRLDLATPVTKPWREVGQRWVLDEFSLKSKDWRKENLVLNIAVGLPF